MIVWPLYSVGKKLTQESTSQKKLHEGKRGGGGSIGPLPSTFDTIHPIDMIFGTCNELPLYFQLSVITWCLTGFHDNHSYIDDVTSGCHLGFLSFQIIFKFELNTENGKKTVFSVFKKFTK